MGVLGGSGAGPGVGQAQHICTGETRPTLPQKVRGLSCTGGNGLDSKIRGDTHYFSRVRPRECGITVR